VGGQCASWHGEARGRKKGACGRVHWIRCRVRVLLVSLTLSGLFRHDIRSFFGCVWEGALDELPITPKFLRLPSESTFAFCVVVFVDDFFQNRPSIVSKET